MNGAQTSALDIVTLVVAIVGVVLAASALAWQAATFVLSGSRVRVTLRRGAIRRQLGELARLSYPMNPTPNDVKIAHDQGFTDEVAIAQVRNRGRLGISVEKVSIETDDEWGFAMLLDPENPKLPHRLELGAMETWHVELRPVQTLVNDTGKPRRVGMVVEFGTGKVIRTRKGILVTPRSS